MDLKHRAWNCLLVYQNQILALLIPVILLPLPVIAEGDEKALCGYVLLWMSCNYILRVVPLGVTATFPILLFPLLGVLSSSATASSYTSEAVMVQFGTLICGVAFEKVGLHRRLAFMALKVVGPRPVRLIWTFAFLSFCISMMTTNVAAAMAILTIVEAMVSERDALLEALNETIEEDEYIESQENTAFDAEEYEEEPEKQRDETEESSIKEPNVVFKQLSIAADTFTLDKAMTSYDIKVEKATDVNWGYALGNSVKFGCILGGMTTPMGSSLNILIMEKITECYDESYQSSPLTFATWMATLLPVCVVMLSLTCLALQFYFIGTGFRSESTKTTQLNVKITEWINKEYETLGSITFPEVVVAILFILLALLWFFMEPGFMPGWGELSIFKEGYIGSAVPTYCICILLFIIPAKPCICGGSDNTDVVETIMDWPTIRHKIPWHVPMLFGAGLAAAAASKETGLDIWLGEQVSKLSHLNPDALLFVLCLLAAFITEVLSTSLMHNVFLPIMCDLSVSLGKSPSFLALPVALCINSNFMMPNAAVNTLCLQFNKTTILQLLATGFLADLLFVCLITGCSLTWFAPILKFDDPFNSIAINATTATIDF